MTEHYMVMSGNGLWASFVADTTGGALIVRVATREQQDVSRAELTEREREVLSILRERKEAFLKIIQIRSEECYLVKEEQRRDMHLLPWEARYRDLGNALELLLGTGHDSRP